MAVDVVRWGEPFTVWKTLHVTGSLASSHRPLDRSCVGATGLEICGETRDRATGIGARRMRGLGRDTLVDSLLARVACRHILAEVRGLIHIDPDTVNVNTRVGVEDRLELL